MSGESKETVDDIPLDWYEGDRYFLNIAKEPNNPNSWCVSVVRVASEESESNTNVVRMDTDHGTPHMDELWLLPKNRDKPEFPGMTVDEAEARLLRNWRKYAYLYASEREEKDVEEPE
ncbi:hypothetical protein EXE46_11615 [Halorubrum sp. GN11_10-6_MGM]|uniref:DUF7718 family protein n=1 Tax=Halorubrum sp. GN11_10-6_MGM TaxID=2518112 RepID=UPI0010F5839B|nr:hypothetical protein [Halorubrum sp. GN11_10-6_MGM]TKX73972.1 hypothetical protein EXE46_11615 [Halorubrum sp. GN11_10-6_MGM]